jgi:predicted nucleic acid-binding Zn ribbon protein
MSANEQSLKDAIGSFLKSSRLSGKLANQKIIDGWEKIMGKMIAKHTKQISIYDKKLFLHLDSAPLKQELFYSREKIIQILNEEAGEEVIKEIVFR